MATEPGRTAGQLGSDHAISRLFPPTGECSDYPHFYPPDFSSTVWVRGNASFGPWLQGHWELSPDEPETAGPGHGAVSRAGEGAVPCVEFLGQPGHLSRNTDICAFLLK